MKTLIPTVDHPFYLWQVLVQIQHFTERDEMANVHWIVGYSGAPSARLRKLQLRFSNNITVVRDARDSLQYAPSLKPWLVGKFMEEQPLERFHYLDPDVLLLQPSDYYEEIPGWSGSSTDSYTGPGYLMSHGIDLWDDLCGIAGADPETARKVPGVGAQWVVGESDAQFWFDVASASTKMYIRCQRQPRKEGQQFAVQSWCAEMYATQLVALAYGFPVQLDPTMSFVWANGESSKMDSFGYFHNAGITSPNGKDFCKVLYQSSPFRQQIRVSEESASYHYKELVLRTEKNWPDLIW